MATIISIDWDFFIYHGMYDWIEIQGEKHPGLYVYDWQMSESRAASFENSLWITRASGLVRMGLDIRQATRMPVSVEDFLVELAIGLEPTWIADSHAWMGAMARDYSKELGEPVEVINFDAHHDLGYHDKINLDNFHCDDWAWVGLHNDWISKYTLVYPDWLGLKEWGPEIQERSKSLAGRIQTTTWTDWANSADRDFDEGVNFICRSSSWTPPWWDREFQTLLDDFDVVDCLDCRHPQDNGYNVCEPRAWDDADVAADVKQWEQVWEMHRKHHGLTST